MAKQNLPQKPRKESQKVKEAKTDSTQQSCLRGTALEGATEKSFGIIQIEGLNGFKVPFLPEHVTGNMAPGDSVQITISVQVLPREKDLKIIAPPVLPMIPGLWPQTFHPVRLNLTGKKGRVSDVRPNTGIAIVITEDGIGYDVSLDSRFRIGDYVVVDPNSTTSSRGPFQMATLVQYCGSSPCS